MTTVANLAQGVPGFTSNAFLVDGDRTVLVDPGNDFDVVSAIEPRTRDLDAVVLTHTHPDHVGNLPNVVTEFDVDVWGYDGDRPDVDHAVADGDTIQFGDDDYRALYTPGHKNDHLCFYSAAANTLFAGDLVFANGGFGRTDLDEGDRDVLIESIDYLLETIDERLEVMHTGHGPSVTSDPYAHVELAARSARMG